MPLPWSEDVDTQEKLGIFYTQNIHLSIKYSLERKNKEKRSLNNIDFSLCS